MGLAPVRVLQALGAGADRQQPVRAHLAIFIAGLQRLVIEGVILRARSVARGPDHRLMRVGEAAAAKIRHRIVLAPDDVVEDPEAEILHDRADAEDIVIGADDEDRRVGLHHAARGGEPVAGEGVIGREIGEFVPVVVDGVDDALVGARQLAWRAGDYRADRRRRDRRFPPRVPASATTQSPDRICVARRRARAAFR